MDIQYQDAAHAASVLLVSDHLVELSAEAALPVVRKEGSSRGGFLVWDGG